MSCNILIWKQWDSNLVSHVTGNHIHVHVHAVIIVYKESPLKRYTCICTCTCISSNPLLSTIIQIIIKAVEHPDTSLLPPSNLTSRLP